MKKSSKKLLNFSSDSLIVTRLYNNETSKRLNLLNEANDSKSVTRKWIIVKDNSNANCNVGNKIIYYT